MTFDESRWRQVIRKPDWYLEFVPYAKQFAKNADEKERGEFNKTVRHFFEQALLNNEVALADSGPDLDAPRKPVDTIVIHHTGHAHYRLSYMQATQLLNIYAPYYMDPTVREERHLKGKAIWSGHFRDGKMSFLAYHWLMRMDGSFERLLDDKQLGWHAGNWEINRRSIGICLDNDYEKQDPADDVLRRLAAHIKKHYPAIKPQNIIGHRECRPGTICPGSNFLSTWKPTLLEYVVNGS